MLPDAITGTSREVDIVVSGRVGAQPVTVSIECRDRSRRPDVTWIDEMRSKHSRLPTNVLVLASHTPFTPEARRVADKYGIRCLVLDDQEAPEPGRLFPDVSSLWGKGWEITVDRVEVSVGAAQGLAAERFKASAETSLFSEDGVPLGSTAELVGAIVRSSLVVDKMYRDAQPEHTHLELVWEQPILGVRLCVQKVEPLVFRPIERLRIVAKSKVTIDEFPLRHGIFGDVRVAWGKGAILGRPALLVASDAQGSKPTITMRFHGHDEPAG
jgi:hypothetical protein